MNFGYRLTQALFTLIASSALVVTSSQAHAGGMIVGANMGMTHYSAEGSDEGVLVLAAPSQDAFFVNFMPGLRIGGYFDDDRRHQVHVDAGVSYTSGDEFSLQSTQLMAAYEYAFSSGDVAPFMNGGLGLMRLSDRSGTIGATVLGVGLGVRRRLPHGHGALRAELRFDRQFEGKEDGALRTAQVDAVGLRLGFDLYIQ